MKSVDKGLAWGEHWCLCPIALRSSGGWEVPSPGRAPPGSLIALAPCGVKLGRPLVATELHTPPLTGDQNPPRWGGQCGGSPGDHPTSTACRTGTRGPESAATCPRPHCQLRVALASSLTLGGVWETGGGGWVLPLPPRPPSQRLPLPGRTLPGSLGPACPLARGQALETNGWCKWAFGGTAGPRHSPAGSL